MQWSSLINALGVAVVVSAGLITLWMIGASLVRSMRERVETFKEASDDDPD